MVLPRNGKKANISKGRGWGAGERSLDMTLWKNTRAEPVEPWRLKGTLNAMGSPKIGEYAFYIFKMIIQKVRHRE